MEPDQNIEVETEQPWYFTFGGSHAHPGGYVRIVGTYEGAREKMISCFGDKWCMQYDVGAFFPQIERYGLKEVILG